MPRKERQKKRNKRIKVIGISAGATPNSRSELLLNSLLDKFLKVGYKISKIAVRDLKISFCDGFKGCEKTGICKWHDDMRIIEKGILSSDIIVVSSPIYFTSLPAKLKAIIDRCQVYWIRKYILKDFNFKLKKGLFISVAGGTPDFSHAEAIIKAFFSVFNIKLVGKYYLPNTDIIKKEEFIKNINEVKKLIKEVVK
ncbi:MAG: hypothetical protein A2474_05455 [Elusimicrobia bacterium RIFOXYC2_FULL_34_12]|nr:MAG: hypothetical protein A2474_05455 [Elusimicrobia bacterium RIFOXYC2_FULL_34_12]OGS38016.1 MAG: hypothetical protein A2551_04975 [Elusimicrobia bacterium RIFOXYD2_FULL_34_30]